MTKPYRQCSREELADIIKRLTEQFEEIKKKDLKLDMSRGKPSIEQLDLSNEMLDILHSGADTKAEDGTDCRSYGLLEGTPEAIRLLAEMSEVSEENVIIYGNSSLSVMFDCVSRCMTHGVLGGEPWMNQGQIKFLCPVPGYDRHFAITEYYDILMINIPMLETGPDMNMVESFVAADPLIKGIWCVPKYSNPTGTSYSDETVRRFAALKPAASDFRIFWDNAYSIHHLYDNDQDFVLEILSECKKAGNPDLVYKFISTSKVTFPGSGVAAVATSARNLEDFRRHMKYQTIGHDKLNQIRHVRFLKDLNGVHEHMKLQAKSLRPKFEAVLETLDRDIAPLDIGTYTRPKGGYFISFNSMEDCASDIVAMAREAGLVMTPAGATYPYGTDPYDSNIRIAPSYPTFDEVKSAMEIFVLCVKLVSAKKLLSEMD